MTSQSEPSPESNRINQDAKGDRNQTIGQVHGGIVVYVSGGQAIINSVDVATAESAKSGPQKLGSNPYKGLLAFNENDSDRYFGRSDAAQILWNKLRDLDRSGTNTRLLPIYGPSGSGKSSLARAGLLPELGRRPLPGREKARVAVLVPGNDPLYSLAVVLAKIATEDPNPVEKADEFKRVLKKRDDSGEFNGLNRIAFGLPQISTSPLVVLVDQFEEIYSYASRGNSSGGQRKQEKFVEERNAFVKNLLYAASDSSQYVLVVITFRSDFLGETHQHPVLNRLFSKQGFLVPTMDEASLEEAIIQPAEAADYSLDPATVNLLIQQTVGREGTLPLLQFALTRIWENLPQEPVQTLREIGGVGGALADEAEQIYGRLSPIEKEIAQRIFLGLIQLGEGPRDTRRRVESNALVAVTEKPGQVQAVLQRFADPGVRLLTLSSAKDLVKGTEITTVEVTHEALLEHWQRLQTWLEAGRDDLRFQRRLENAARYWNQHKKDDRLVWSSPNLELLEDFYQRTIGNSTPLKFTPLQLEFYQASQLQKEQSINRLRRERLMERGLIALSFLFAGSMGLVALVSWRSLRIVAYQKGVTEAVFLGTSSQEISDSLPELEASANKLQDEIDTLPETIDPEIAIAHYQKNEADFKKLFAYYRNILTVTGRLNRETGQDETERAERVEGVLGALLNKYRLPQLEIDLASNQYSTFLEQPVTAFEEQYSEGAVRTTYEILMANSGAGADLNRDGFIADVQEANQVPCITLQKIEALWREATDRACGWYTLEGPYADDRDCGVLDTDKSTLYTAIFDFNTDHAFVRLQSCGLLPE